MDTKAPDFFFIGIDQSLKQDFQDYVLMGADPGSELVVVPITTAKIQSINGIDPRTYIERQNPLIGLFKKKEEFLGLMSRPPIIPF